MKKIISTLFLVLAIVFTTDAQQKRKMKKEMTVEQAATLAAKKMTLELDLSNTQQRKMKNLLITQITERRAFREQMRKAREEKKQLSSDERYERANDRLDKQLAFQKEVKSILDADQFEKFKEMEVKKRMATRKRMGNRMKKMAMKKRKENKDLEEDNDE